MIASLIGVPVNTLQRWDREGRLKAQRTPGNRRVYTNDHLSFVHKGSRPTKRMITEYARVSSQARKPDLDNQVRVLEQFCAANGWAVDEWVKEVGGGLNFRRGQFLKLLDMIVSGRIERLVVAHKDRPCRFGFEMVEHLCHSPEREMVQDMLAIGHCFSARLCGLRNYRKALR